VPRSYDWPIQGLSLPPGFNSFCPASASPYPIGIAIFAGYYVPMNVSSGYPLNLAKPGPYYCGYAGNFQSYYFSPNSNFAVLAPNDTTNIFIHASTIVNGSWVSGKGATFAHFSTGAYTVVEGDEWGDLLFLYFKVT
jgi:hypothetical protein